MSPEFYDKGTFSPMKQLSNPAQAALLSFALLVAGLLNTGCESAGLATTPAFQPENYRTVAVTPVDASSLAQARPNATVLVPENTRGAAMRLLQEKGYAVREPGQADLIVNLKWWAFTAEDRDFPQIESDTGLQSPRRFQEGRLQVTVTEAATGEVIWRTWSQRRLDLRTPSQAAISDAVEWAFNRFPARRNAAESAAG